jgi:peptidoglycan/LPS O-acetylase OafA/YrhL
MRFDALEGARAWLAWTVVVVHVAVATRAVGLHEVFGQASGAAGWSVSIFIAISGFVITHMIVTRPEGWRPYITRRAFRIFPLYLIAYGLALLAAPLGVAALAYAPWMAGSEYAREIQLSQLSEVQFFWPHLLTHLSLMQGLAPDALLPFSSRVTLPPAWSLSLEWQFYLVAPIWVGLMRGPKGAVIGAFAALLAVLVWKVGLDPYYRLPSILPGKAIYFLVGIAARLAFDGLRRLISEPAATLAGLLILLGLGEHAVALVAFAMLMVLIVAGDRERSATGAQFIKLANLTLSSPLALAAGRRSFAIYAAHWPILQLATWLVFPQVHGAATAFLGVAALLIPTTLVLAEVLYRLVELPMIRVGARIAGQWAPASTLAAAEGRPALGRAAI